MGAWPEREAPAERIASVVLAVEKGMDSSIPFSVALCFFRHCMKSVFETWAHGIFDLCSHGFWKDSDSPMYLSVTL